MFSGGFSGELGSPEPHLQLGKDVGAVPKEPTGGKMYLVTGGFIFLSGRFVCPKCHESEEKKFGMEGSASSDVGPNRESLKNC